ncbi:MAG: alcohol dehydrogenase catalytic domain-containing protein, partial [Chloroflexi bacterium]|nr:alcohol dehydrogenase catalytic domain-containing protein [Chloroflexota bacterium]
MKDCRAAVLTAFHAPLEVRRYPLPTALEDAAVLVRVEMAGVCGTDVHLWQGQLPIALPVILGHESVGVVAEIGGDTVRGWDGSPIHPGDRITWSSSRSCGRCRYCVDLKLPTRCPSRRAYGISYPADTPPHLSGGFAEYIVLQPGTALFPLPPALATEDVIGSGCALVTAIHGVERAGV